MRPQTLEEWQTYIDTLDAHDLYQAAFAAGGVRFMQTLIREGYIAADITEIHKMFAVRFLEMGLEPPGVGTGCVVDFRRLA